jgi:hypothetical protein
MGRGRGDTQGGTTFRRQTAQDHVRGWQWHDLRKLEAELRAFTAHRSTFPTRREFDEAGRADLRCAVARYGGVPHWSARLGLQLSARQRSREPYSTGDAVQEARLIVEAMGYLPGARKLRAMRRQRLASAVQAEGGARRFTERHLLQS